MRDGDCGTPFRGIVESFLDDFLSMRVEGACRFVEKKNTVLGYNAARNSNTLFLATR